MQVFATQKNKIDKIILNYYIKIKSGQLNPAGTKNTRYLLYYLEQGATGTGVKYAVYTAWHLERRYSTVPVQA